MEYSTQLNDDIIGVILSYFKFEEIILYRSVSKNWSELCVTSITSLDIGNNTKITDENLKMLTSITSLNLCDNTKITDESLKMLTSIISLNLRFNNIITDESLKFLTFCNIIR